MSNAMAHVLKKYKKDLQTDEVLVDKPRFPDCFHVENRATPPVTRVV